MSEHCQYVVFPADDRDPFVVESHPYSAMVSDDLGGAMPGAIFLDAAKTAMWVRETGATEGSARNITASVIATLLAGSTRPIMILGPAVLTSLVPIGISPTGLTVVPEGFDGGQAVALVTVATDVRQALGGSNGPFKTSGLMDGWAVKVRWLADQIRARPVADNWPDSENRAPEPRPDSDPVCRILERAYPGRQFGPVPHPDHY